MPDDDLTFGEVMAQRKKDSQHQRSENRKHGVRRLREVGIDFEIHNDGAHLIVDRPRGLVDYWPGTGLWIDRQATTRRGKKKRGRGIRSLIAWVQQWKRKATKS